MSLNIIDLKNYKCFILGMKHFTEQISCQAGYLKYAYQPDL
jgi:hypothetical protein